jgi:hypothetical protein
VDPTTTDQQPDPEPVALWRRTGTRKPWTLVGTFPSVADALEAVGKGDYFIATGGDDLNRRGRVAR